MEIIEIGADLYVKLDLGSADGRDPGLQGRRQTKLAAHRRSEDRPTSSHARVPPSEGSIGADSFVKGVVTAEKVSDTEIKGTIDLTKSARDVLGDAARSRRLATRPRRCRSRRRSTRRAGSPSSS